MTAVGPKRRRTISARMSAIEGTSGLVVLTISFVGRDPTRTSAMIPILRFMECRAMPALVRLDARKLDHLRPLFGFVGDQLCELSRRSRQRHAAEVSETGPHPRVVESRVDLLVELVDDLGGRVPGCADPVPKTCLVARHELAHSRD